MTPHIKDALVIKNLTAWACSVAPNVHQLAEDSLNDGARAAELLSLPAAELDTLHNAGPHQAVKVGEAYFCAGFYGIPTEREAKVLGLLRGPNRNPHS